MVWVIRTNYLTVTVHLVPLLPAGDPEASQTATLGYGGTYNWWA